jgi:hypothetical protein
MNLPKIGDILAIPFFLLLCIYFYKKNILTLEEKILYLFAIGGLCADMFFVLIIDY